MTHREALIVQRLRTPHERSVFLADAAADRIDPHRAREILDTLARAGLVAARPTSRTVVVLGLGAPGLRIAQGLLDAGVRSVHLVDDDAVRPDEVPLGGPDPARVGRARDAAAAEFLTGRYPQADVTWGPRTPDPALAVITGLALVAARQAGRFLAADVPHLPLVLSGDGICVGPVVRPGWDACVHCMQLHRLDADRQWATRCLEAARSTPGPALIALAAAAAVAQATAHLDGLRSGGPSVRFRGPDGTPDLVDWEPHPRCGCRDQPSVRALA